MRLIKKCRPETSKCSRLEKRRLTSQSQQTTHRLKTSVQKLPIESQVEEPQQVIQQYNGMTLEQYFKGRNFQIVEIKEEEWDHDLDTSQKQQKQHMLCFIIDISNLADTKTNFRIKRMSATKKVTKPEPQEPKRMVGVSVGTKNNSKMELNNTKLRFYQKKEDPSYEKTLKQNPYAIYQPKQEIKKYSQKGMLITSKDFFPKNEKILEEDDILRRTYVDDKFLNLKNQIHQRFQNEEQELFNKYAAKFNILPEVNQPRTNLRLKEIYSKLK